MKARRALASGPISVPLKPPLVGGGVWGGGDENKKPFQILGRTQDGPETSGWIVLVAFLSRDNSTSNIA